MAAFLRFRGKLLQSTDETSFGAWTRFRADEVPMGSLSPIHWLIVLVVILLLFGPSRLANAGKGLGEGIKSLKNAFSDDPPKEKEEPDALPEKRG